MEKVELYNKMEMCTWETFTKMKKTNKDNILML